ncbi:stem cell self-renewal protein Piwi [Aulographum hederae CBS 113979]|uniref:Stem cell self-renewal protein Piwi n=1 Tax=Aulographum hederae CBS 113979 TaxID=1176131 RepID=A0A6G1GQH7_9PEZI|nr:stem cell self-renewal protein Piwi [Aulographum hederae CBS 113979]
MKVNMKTGGINHTIEGVSAQLRDTMILGADVTHPGAGSLPCMPSIAAVVGSIDAEGSKLCGSMRRQTERVEMIKDLEGMVYERLMAYGAVNKKLPSKILFYRDGVADSQYVAVRTLEIPQIRKAWERVQAEKQLKTPPLQITAVVVGKRHHTRFYPEPLANGQPDPARAAKNGNSLAGTLVDQGVTSPYYFDFFLQSHHGLQGTARPAHYFVLENEINFGARGLQELTHKLCYTYQRATIGVSYVPAAYCADRLCERGRVYLRNFLNPPMALFPGISNQWFGVLGFS